MPFGHRNFIMPFRDKRDSPLTKKVDLVVDVWDNSVNIFVSSSEKLTAREYRAMSLGVETVTIGGSQVYRKTFDNIPIPENGEKLLRCLTYERE